MDKILLSVALATRNEETNIGACLESVKDIADEIVIVDEESTDRTRDIAEKYGARVSTQKHEPIFHITKQKAIDLAKGEWILQLDADERITDELAAEIEMIVHMDDVQIRKYLLDKEKEEPKKAKLFKRHQEQVEQRDGKIGKSTGEIVAFFIPRRNLFLGKPLLHAGVYPDPAIRLIKKDKARLPARSVHEVMEIDGEIGWMYYDMIHIDSPTFNRYLARANRYTDLTMEEMKKQKIGLGVFTLLRYSFAKPLAYFLKLYIRHLGILDGMRGFVWSLFSALHFPIAYFKYYSVNMNMHKVSSKRL